MATDFSAHALEWWLRERGKFVGAKVSTKEVSPGQFDITDWDANGVAKPSDAEVTQIISDYNASIIQKKTDDTSAATTGRAKLKGLGLTDAEVDALLK